MSLYYFHIRSGVDYEEDTEGSDLPDIDAAHAEAVRMAWELSVAVPEFDADTVIEIADDTGQIMQRVFFSDAIGSIQ
jgi:hypothetical protein